MRTPPSLGQVAPRTGHGQTAELHAARGDEAIGQTLEGAGLPARHEHFKAVMVIEMHVERGDDVDILPVLRRGEPSGQESGVVIVDEGDRGNSLLRASAPGLVDQASAHEVADGLRAIVILSANHPVIERREKLGVHCQAEARELTSRARRHEAFYDATHTDRDGQPRRVGVQWILETDEADVVRRMFRRYADGIGLGTIAARLNSQDVLSPRQAKKHRLRRDGVGPGWDLSAVRVILIVLPV